MSRRIASLIDQLKSNPEVLGLIRYGGRSVGEDAQGGDFDLFAIVRGRDSDLESLHFYWRTIPVDLSLRTRQDLQRESPISHIDVHLLEGEILFDRKGDLPDLLEIARGQWTDANILLTEQDIKFSRFSHTHALDKVRGRLTTEPLFCEFLLSANILWLVKSYFNIRRKPYPGEKGALSSLMEKEPEIGGRIKAFFDSKSLKEKLRISEKLTELVLAPVGGSWRRGEVVGLGVDCKSKNLCKKASQAFSLLLCTPPEDAAR